jgi:hypothetical protein
MAATAKASERNRHGWRILRRQARRFAWALGIVIAASTFKYAAAWTLIGILTGAVIVGRAALRTGLGSGSAIAMRGANQRRALADEWYVPGVDPDPQAVRARTLAEAHWNEGIIRKFWVLTLGCLIVLTFATVLIGGITMAVQGVDAAAVAAALTVLSFVIYIVMFLLGMRHTHNRLTKDHPPSPGCF